MGGRGGVSNRDVGAGRVNGWSFTGGTGGDPSERRHNN